MIVYMMVTADKYELPIVVADTFSELEQLTGVDKSQLCRVYKRNLTIRRKRDGVLYKVIKVDIGDIEE